MSLMDDLKAEKPLEEEVVISGKKFLVIGRDLARKSRVYASARNDKGELDLALVDAGYLSLCVCDPQTRNRIGEPKDWKQVAAHVTAPLLEAVGRVMGAKVEGAADPNDLDSIPN